VPKDFVEEQGYSQGFELTELMPFKSSGIKTHDDINLVSDSRERLEKNLINLNQQFDNSKVCKYSYRPFDNGYIYYDTKLLGRAREKTIYHLKNDNIGLILVAQPQAANLNFFDCVYVTNCFTDTNMFRRGGPCAFPLYIYPASTIQQTIGLSTERTPNLNAEIVKRIAEKLGLSLTNEKETTENTFAPIDILDYIYAVLHSPTYREKYKEFLKIDFPRVPYPKDKDTFWHLVKLGKEIRQIHLLASPTVEKYITQYPIDGNNVVTKPNYQNGKVYINDTQYFDNVPETAWNFYIGGYQPAQKWLKDRKDRKLEFEDILHYQKIIVALSETDRLMKEIDKIEIE
jgi:predicted helicase